MEFRPESEIERLGGRLISLGDELMLLSSHIETYGGCVRELAVAEKVREVSRAVRRSALQLSETKERIR